MLWEDTYRDEWFTKDKIDTRKIVVQIWYPASEKSDSLYPYMDYQNLRIESIANRIGKSKAFIKPVGGVEGNSYFKAKPIDQKFPLILFSHGLGGYKTQNSINIESLVSQGYIVVAPDHTYDATITLFPDGTAAEQGLKKGDVIIEVAQTQNNSPKDVNDKIEEVRAEGRKSILLLMERPTGIGFVALRIGKG